MKTCKQCIHNCVCPHLKDTDAKRCKQYIDKSRCKIVFDKVYQTDGVRIYESDVKGIIYDCGSFAFDYRAIGHTVFLTREEAEEELKERG